MSTAVVVGRRRPGSGFSFWTLVTILALGIFAFLLLYPVLSLFINSLVSGGTSDSPWWEPYVNLFTRKLYYESFLNSLILAASATVGALVLGTPLAYFVSRLQIPGKIVVRSAIVLTFVSPPFIGAYAWVVMFGNTGLVRVGLESLGLTVPPIYGWLGTILVLTLQGVPYVFLYLSSGLKTVDQSVEDAAINLGYTRGRAAFNAVFPLLKPALSTSALLVFVTAFADIGTPMVIGQNLRVFPRLVYQSFTSEVNSDFRLAASLALVMVVVTVGALLFQRWYSRRHSYGQDTVRGLVIVPARRGPLAAATLYVYVILALACVPLVVVVISSFLRFSGATITGEWTLENYAAAPGLLSSLTNTLLTSTLATALCVVFGTLIGYIVARRSDRIAGVIDVLSMVPFAVAGVVFGISFSLGFGGAPFYLAGTITILALAYFIRRLPFSVRAASSQLAQMGRQTEEASVNLGVPPGRTFLKITLPMLVPAVASGTLLTWATVVKEFNATIILYGATNRTMSIEIFRAISAGQFQYASAIGTILILLALVPIVLLFAVTGKDEEILV
ncbi:MAG: iron ABC transporter permease [Propionicimonas sp.]|nr:iron ABC transporter permease [Propionicimonas sp.]MEA5116396.1 iron ABC transporter permease [Propionicimonas sp.]